MADLITSLTVEQKGDIVLAPKTAANNPGQIDGAPIVELISGDCTFEQNPDTPLVVTVVAPDTTGTAVFLIRADKNTDPEVVDEIVSQVTIAFSEAGTETIALTMENVRPKVDPTV